MTRPHHRNSQTVFKTEAELAQHLIAWLKDQHWEIYQEVDAGNIADIVAVQGPLLWIIECKLSLGLVVMEQAENWIGQAHYVSIAAPSSRANPFSQKILRWLGIGLLRVSPWEYDWQSPIKEEIPARLFRRLKRNNIGLKLYEAQKTYAEAGVAHGRRWSPFKQTCENLLKYVTSHPGCNLKEMIDKVETHYGTASTARSCIKKWVEAGKVPGIRMVKENGELKFYKEEGRG